jgi:hypothetical protein
MYTLFTFVSVLFALSFATACPLCFPASGPTNDQGIMAPSDTKQTFYFGYGSNLWLKQMETRCPTSKYLGVARLDGYRWIINDRGYANVVETNTISSSEQDESTTGAGDEIEKYNGNFTDVVFGLVYSLQKEDEKRLDKNEGVPIAYTKEDLNCTFWESRDGGWVDVRKKTRHAREMLVYIDRNRTVVDRPKKEVS